MNENSETKKNAHTVEKKSRQMQKSAIIAENG